MELKNNLQGGEKKELFKMAIELRKADVKILGSIIAIFIAIANFQLKNYAVVAIAIILLLIIWKVD